MDTVERVYLDIIYLKQMNIILLYIRVLDGTENPVTKGFPHKMIIHIKIVCSCRLPKLVFVTHIPVKRIVQRTMVRNIDVNSCLALLQ